MSGLRPFFITGANAKIVLNGKTLAFCTDVSYSIQVLTQTPKVLGMYEGSSVEPLGYSVTGSFTIIRYAKDAAKILGTHPNGVATNDAGNGVGNWGNVWGGSGVINGQAILEKAGLGNSGRPNEALDPSRFDKGTTFDVQIYQKIPNAQPSFGMTGTLNEQLQGAANSIAGFLRGDQLNASDLIGVANIRNCRITQADFSLTKKGVAVQRFTFAALYVDEDAFVADFSGKGQQL